MNCVSSRSGWGYGVVGVFGLGLLVGLVSCSGGGGVTAARVWLSYLGDNTTARDAYYYDSNNQLIQIDFLEDTGQSAVEFALIWATAPVVDNDSDNESAKARAKDDAQGNPVSVTVYLTLEGGAVVRSGNNVTATIQASERVVSTTGTVRSQGTYTLRGVVSADGQTLTFQTRGLTGTLIDIDNRTLTLDIDNVTTGGLVWRLASGTALTQ